MSKLMILGGSILQLPAIKRAIDLGHQVIVADMDPEALGFEVEGVQREIISTIDVQHLLESAKKNRIDGIMTLATDMPMRAVAVIAKELGLVGISEKTALLATNKGFMRDALKSAGVPIPCYYRVNTFDEYEDAVRNIFEKGYSCIVKPADNSGSRGITLISHDSSNEITYAFFRAKESSRSGELMVEEYMSGPEVSVETISFGGQCHVIQITDKITNGAPFFVEMGHSQPSTLDDEIKEIISEIAILANKALGIETGPSHTEIKVTEEGPKIVEIGARLGGDNITTYLTPLSTGVDMVESCIKIALGQVPNLTRRYEKASAIKYFPFSEGILNGFSGLEEASKIEGVQDIHIVHGPGTIMHGIRSSSDRIGYVISQADTPEKAIEICDHALTLISYL